MKPAVALWLAVTACFGSTGVLAKSEMSESKTAAADLSSHAFEIADYDGDKKISFEEYRNRSIHIFHDMDHNGDDRIAGNEHPPAVTADGKAVQPGDVTIHDFHVALRGYFDAADADKDGFLSMAEWKADGSSKSN